MPNRYLYVLCGLPFAGKSTLARHLASERRCRLVEYDAINTERGFGLNGAAIPTHEFEATEREALRRVHEALRSGQCAVYDAASFLRRQRDELRQVAAEHGARMLLVWVDVSPEVARSRWRRNRETRERSDVRDEDFALVLERFEPPAAEEMCLRFDGRMSPADWADAKLPHES